MKNVLFALVLLTGLSSFAKGTGDVGSVGTLQEISSKALATLLKANPSFKNSGGESQMLVSEALPMIMTSSFDDKGVGALSVVTNSCTPRAKSAIYDCRLIINSTDMRINSSGGYSRTKESTESSLLIDYSVINQGGVLFGEVTGFFAG